MSRPFSRRQALTIGAGALSAVSAASPFTPALALSEDAAAVIADFTGGVTPIPDTRVVIELPKEVESGNAVALTVRVESPMTEASRVSELLVVAMKNGKAKIGRYAFFLPNGVPRVTTRIRLERPPAQIPSPTQTVIVTAVAKVRQGGIDSFLFRDQQVSVIGGACEC